MPAALVVVVVLLILPGCGGSGHSGGGAGSDQMHTAARENLKPGFSFLPPLGDPVTGNVALSSDAQPVVEVFAGSWADKGASFVTFEGSAIATQGDGFQVNWDTGAANGGLPSGLTGCVIQVSWDGVPLGYVDCQIDRSSGRGRTAADPEFFGLQNGRTLPIKFSIARSLAVIGAQGGTVASADGNVSLTVPSGALGEATPISVEPLTPSVTSDRLVPGSAYEFGPDGTTFSQPVQVTVRFDSSRPPEYGWPSQIRLLRFEGSTWKKVDGSELVGTDTVTAALSSFSQYSAGVPLKVAWYREPGLEVFAGNADGTGDTVSLGTGLNPTLSGKGKQVVWWPAGGPGSPPPASLCVAPTDGSAPPTLINVEPCLPGFPWSRYWRIDGLGGVVAWWVIYLNYTGYYADHADCYVARAGDGWRPVRLAELNGPQIDFGGLKLTLSGDGKTVAWGSSEEGYYVGSTNGSGMPLALTDHLWHSPLSLNWDGTRLAYLSRAAGGALVVANADGTGSPTVIGAYNCPILSGDGSRLLANGHGGINLIDLGAGGSPVIRLLPGGCQEHSLSADGTVVAWFGPEGVWCLDVDDPSQTKRKVADSSGGAMPTLQGNNAYNELEVF